MVISTKYELIPYSNHTHLVHFASEPTLGVRSVRAIELEKRHVPLGRPQLFTENNPPANHKKTYNSQQRMEFSKFNQMGLLIDIYV